MLEILVCAPAAYVQTLTASRSHKGEGAVYVDRNKYRLLSSPMAC